MPDPQPDSLLTRCAALLPQEGGWRLALAEGHLRRLEAGEQADFIFSGAGMTAELAARLRGIEGVESAVFVPGVRAVNLRLSEDALWLGAAIASELAWRGGKGTPVGDVFPVRYAHLRARRYADFPVTEKATEETTRVLLSAILLAGHSTDGRVLFSLVDSYLRWHEEVLAARAAGKAWEPSGGKAKKEAIQAQGGCAILARAVARLTGGALCAWRIEPI